jgi:hypothetical protein
LGKPVLGRGRDDWHVMTPTAPRTVILGPRLIALERAQSSLFAIPLPCGLQTR